MSYEPVFAMHIPKSAITDLAERLALEPSHYVRQGDAGKSQNALIAKILLIS